MENESKNMTYEMEMEADAIMPDGWAEGDDFFDADSWTGAKEEAGAASAEEPTGAEESAIENSEAEEAPATEQPAEEEVKPEEAPATEQPSKIKVKYQFDHKDVEEDIDPADLPELLQRARSLDRYKARAAQSESETRRAASVAKVLGYESAEAMFTAVLENARNGEKQTLIEKGAPEAMVNDYIARKYALPAVEQPKAEQPKAEQARAAAFPFAQQAQELLNEYPQLRGTQLPEEILKASASGTKTLLSAYREYKAKLDTAERNSLLKENQILKQNAAAAAKAPVSGVSKGGSTKVTAEDDFLRGFNADW